MRHVSHRSAIRCTPTRTTPTALRSHQRQRRSIRSLGGPEYGNKLHSVSGYGGYRRPSRPPKPKTLRNKANYHIYLENKYTYDMILAAAPHARLARKSKAVIHVIMDTGATISITGLRRLFRILVQLLHPVIIKMGKGTATATEIGIIEWTIQHPTRRNTYYIIPEIVLYCEDFRDITIVSISSWEKHNITYVQNRHNKYVESPAGKQLPSLPRQLSRADLENHSIITCHRSPNGLSIINHVQRHNLPKDASKVNFLIGGRYEFDYNLVRALDGVSGKANINFTLCEGAHLTIMHLVQHRLHDTVIPFCDLYHGGSVMDRVKGDLNLQNVGGYDNSPPALLRRVGC